MPILFETGEKCSIDLNVRLCPIADISVGAAEAAAGLKFPKVDFKWAGYFDGL